MFKANIAVLNAAAVLIALSATQLWAAPPPADVYEASYFLGLHQPGRTGLDATITILDPGTNGSGNLCADIYILNPSEELESCCGCKLTPDEILSGSVVKNLLSNNVSPIWLANGVIKIIASAPTGGTCNPAAPVATPTMRSWLTRIDTTNTPGGINWTANVMPNNYGVTTTQFADATLSAAEESSLATRCGDILLVGSGYGSCKCPTEPLNENNVYGNY